MAKNLLQASEVYTHRPIALQEAPEPWQTAEAVLDTLLDPKQRRAERELDLQEEEIMEGKRQFDKRSELESERISIMAQDVQGRQKIARMDAERRKLDDARDDFFRYGANRSPDVKIALGYQYGLTDLAEQAEKEKVRSDDAMAEINSVRKSVALGEVEPVAIKNILDKHSSAISEMSSWNSGYINEVNRDLEGYAAKQTLLSLRDTIGDDKLKNLGIDTGNWTKASPTQSRTYLASDDISNIKDMATIISDNIGKMEELGLTQTQQYKDAVKMQTGIIDRYSNLIGIGQAKIETEKERLAKKRDRLVTVQTEDVGDVEELERDEDYYVTFADNSGTQRSKTMTGQMAREQIDSYGNKIISAEKRIQVVDKGRPTIKIGATVKDAKTGNILKYKGVGSLLSTKYFGTELMEFEDSAGNIVRYRLKDIMDVGASKEIFVSPSKKETEDFDMRYAQKIPQEVEEGGSWWEGIGGVFESARAAQRKAVEERNAKAAARKKGGMQKGGMVGDTTEARLDEIDKILGPVPNEAAMV